MNSLFITNTPLKQVQLTQIGKDITPTPKFAASSMSISGKIAPSSKLLMQKQVKFGNFNHPSRPQLKTSASQVF